MAKSKTKAAANWVEKMADRGEACDTQGKLSEEDKLQSPESRGNWTWRPRAPAGEDENRRGL